MTPEPTRTYKYQLTADEFKFAFSATEAEFTERADEMRNKGVERLTGNEFTERFKMGLRDPSTDHKTYTLIVDADVITKNSPPPIKLEDIRKPVYGLILLRCQILAGVELLSCTLASIENNETENDSTSFYFFETTLKSYFGISHSTVGDFWIKQCTINSVWIQQKSEVGDFYISQSTTGDFNVSQSTTGNFYISNQSTVGNFFIKESTVDKFSIAQSAIGDFSFEQSTTGDFSIREQSTTGSFSIREQSTMGGFYICDQSTTGYFGLEQCTTGYFSIERSTTGYFSIEQSTTGYFRVARSISGEFLIADSEMDYFSADGFFNSIHLIKVSIPQFRLWNSNLPEMRIDSGCRIECYVANSAINLIDLQHLTLGKESVVSMFNCTVYACLMDEFAVLGNLFFRQIIKANEPFTWYDPVAKSEGNEGRLAVLQQHTENYEKHKTKLDNELTINQPTFRIAQSSLGKTEFTNCDLGGFRFEFNNAKITEVFMSGGTVPQEHIDSSNDKNVIIYGEKKYTLAWHEQKVSLYNQLKKIFDGQGDVYRSTFYNALTAKHQQRTLQIRRGVQYSEKKNWFRRTWKRGRTYIRSKLPTDLTLDVLTFKLNQYSNLHGESWGRALIFTLLGSIPIYVLFLASAGLISVNAPVDWNLVGAYFSFIDPIHRLDFLTNVKGHSDLKLSGWSSPVDFLGRIVVGYGIYQFISAFRKHGRK